MRNLPTYDLSGIEKPGHSVESDDTFNVYCRKGADAIEIAILEDIGDDGWGGGVTSVEIKHALASDPTAPVVVSINSPGGLAYEGIAIYNQLASHRGEVTTINEGLAYSAASVIFMAGDKRMMHEASQFGIHRARGGAYGKSTDLLGVATFLDELDDLLIDLYQRRTGAERKQVVDWIDGSTNGEMGTMFAGQAAIDAGFATDVLAVKEPEARAPVEAVAQLEDRCRQSVLPLALRARREMIDTHRIRG